MEWLADGSGRGDDWVRQYERLRRATETYREDLVLRLGAEAGLQPVEMSGLTPEHVADRPVGGTDLYPLSVPGDGRTAYLPADVEHDLRKYATTGDVGEADPVFSVTPRRIQMLVSDVGDRAADRTGRDELADLSSRDLRRYFARRLLADGVPPSVVMRVGGWDRLESLAPFIDEPTDAQVVDALAGRRGGGVGQGGHRPHSRAVGGDVGRPPGDIRPPTGTARAGRTDRTGLPPGRADAERVGAVLELARAVSDALSSATTREQLDETLCDRFGESAAYRFAWVAPREPETRVSPTAVGVDEAAVAALRESVPAPGDVDERRVARTADVRLPSEDGPVTVTSVPLVHGETTYGLLHLGTSPGTVSAAERDVLSTLGRHAGSAIAAAERKRLLIADTVTRLRFRCADADEPFVRVSASLGCTCSLRGVAPIEDRSLLCFLAVRGATTERVFDELDAAPEISNTRLIRDRGEESLLEVVLAGESLLTTIAAHDGTVSEFVAEDGEARFGVDLSNEIPLRTVMGEVTDAFPSTELRSKREVERDPQGAADFRESVETELTDKQHSALRAAYLAGYFEWPRESTAEDLADSIDVSSPTLHQHLRTAQQKLLTSFFDDADVATDH